MVLGPENGKQEAEEKHHQAQTHQANDCNAQNQKTDR